MPPRPCPGASVSMGSSPAGLASRRQDVQGRSPARPLKCGYYGDHFTALQHMKTPATPMFVRNRSLDGCVAECLGNCSCTAYAYANLSNAISGGGDQSRCLLWFGELVDMEKYVQTTGEDLYLRFAGSTGTSGS
ncbi:hypothetical protein PR202_gb14249 [Eleusine coracana subsp. coracana]|uniref:Apple domain-containing protein n=1 Tax=Eleusine coracana subsp. coracana TaxID=191504 RepID=A0AAV5EW69_ELECO|nr:hypothetical protein PR202_gb14249 [Eleusine coracana subsp. coracana]